jgi:hypothetical protein
MVRCWAHGPAVDGTDAARPGHRAGPARRQGPRRRGHRGRQQLHPGLLALVGVLVSRTSGSADAEPRSKIIENLAVVNYDTNNLYLAPYDWRLSYANLEERDGYFSRLKSMIEGFRCVPARSAARAVAERTEVSAAPEGRHRRALDGQHGAFLRVWRAARRLTACRSCL